MATIDSKPELICRSAFHAQELVDAYPPRLRHRNKKAVYEIACPPGCRPPTPRRWACWSLTSRQPAHLISCADRVEPAGLVRIDM